MFMGGGILLQVLPFWSSLRRRLLLLSRSCIAWREMTCWGFLTMMMGRASTGEKGLTRGAPTPASAEKVASFPLPQYTRVAFFACGISVHREIVKARQPCAFVGVNPGGAADLRCGTAAKERVTHPDRVLELHHHAETGFLLFQGEAPPLPTTWYLCCSSYLYGYALDVCRCLRVSKTRPEPQQQHPRAIDDRRET